MVSEQKYERIQKRTKRNESRKQRKNEKEMCEKMKDAYITKRKGTEKEQEHVRQQSVLVGF